MGQARTCGRRAGFTLLEAMIVVVVVAIASALAVARLGSTSQQQLVGAAQLMAGDLGFAQIESVTKSDDPRAMVLLTPPGQPHGYRIEASSTPGVAVTNPVGKTPYEVTFGRGRAASLKEVAIDSHTFGSDNKLGFGLYGQLDQSTPATVTLAARGQTVTLTIDAVTGEVTIGPVQ